MIETREHVILTCKKYGGPRPAKFLTEFSLLKEWLRDNPAAFSFGDGRTSKPPDPVKVDGPILGLINPPRRTRGSPPVLSDPNPGSPGLGNEEDS